MPIYEYRCGECGHQQEVLQKVSDAPLTVCPQCHKPALAKMLTAAGFQLKGSGWYATDFRSKGAAAKSGGTGGDAAKSDAPKGDDGKAGESKAAAPAGGCGTNCGCH